MICSRPPHLTNESQFWHLQRNCLEPTFILDWYQDIKRISVPKRENNGTIHFIHFTNNSYYLQIRFELKMLLRTPLNRRKPWKKSEDERILFKIWDREKCLNNVIPAPFVRKRCAKKWSRRFWCGGVAIFTTFLHCVCQMRLDAQSEEYISDCHGYYIIALLGNSTTRVQVN